MKNNNASGEAALENKTVRQQQTQSKQQTSAHAEDRSKNFDLELLDVIYKTADMGKIALETIINKIKDIPFKNVLLSEYQSYDALTSRISVAITNENKTPRSGSSVKSSMLKNTIKAKLVFNDSPSHIADMLIKGNNMGITTINKKLNSCREDCSKPSTDLANDLLELQQKQIDELKIYL